mgnify:CR=1 FL=1
MREKKNITDELLAKINTDAVVARGFDEAFVGYARRAGRPSIALYDYKTCVDILFRDEGWSKEKSVMFMEDFILDYDAGEASPAFCFWKDEYDKDEL